MIEVEVRGWLTQEQAEELETWLKKHGKHLRSQDRELILLKDGYPGCDQNMLKRRTDIRFKKTNGQVEIVVKERASEGNVGRYEYTYPVAIDSIDALIPLARAFGATKALWMRRDAEIYKHDGIEWSIIRAVRKDGKLTKLHFEAELATETEDQIPAAQERLETAVAARGLAILTADDHEAFIAELGRTVNQSIDLIT